MNPVLDVKTLLAVSKKHFQGLSVAAQGTDTIFTDFAYQTNFMISFGINSLIQIFLIHYLSFVYRY